MNQFTHVKINPFRECGYKDIQKSIETLKQKGIIMSDENDIMEICNIIVSF